MVGVRLGKGRGKQVIAVARTADLVLMVLDAAKVFCISFGGFWSVFFIPRSIQGDVQRRLLVQELENVGIRLNQEKPNITFKVWISFPDGDWIFAQHASEQKKATGGISFNATVPLTHMDLRLCTAILHEYSACDPSTLTGVYCLFTSRVAVDRGVQCRSLVPWRSHRRRAH
jgi:ribosome-interacting GTPase 1